MHLMNGNTAARVRKSEGCEVLPCGCACTTTEWLQMCDVHYEQWRALHEAGKVARLVTILKVV